MTRMLFGVVVALILAMVFPGGTAHGPMTEDAKKEKRFFNCIRAMDAADQDGDDKLSKDEYSTFVRKLALAMFEDDSVLDSDDELPQEVTQLYDKLIAASGSEEGATHINIFGASLKEIQFVNEATLEKLHAV
jgi:hypothetical protein